MLYGQNFLFVIGGVKLEFDGVSFRSERSGKIIDLRKRLKKQKKGKKSEKDNF